jgi:ribosomal-protein-alanine N-acetyltransferase
LKTLKKSIKGESDFIFLETRQNNTAALSLYKSFGFEKIGVRKKYYKNEDALTLRTINRSKSTNKTDLQINFHT